MVKVKPAKRAKLNPQALARRDKGLMECLVAYDGSTLVSCDLGSGEPTVSTHYSRDKNYEAACFGMIGKAPYYDGNVLMIDDIYLMVMSVSPIGAKTIRALFDAGVDGMTFAEAWLKDPEYIQKKLLKAERQLHKVLALGLGYSMGAKKLVKTAYDAGHDLPFRTAKEFFAAYWRLFDGLATLGQRLQDVYIRDGHLINDFGYRLLPDSPHKCLNYFIQSSVSGIMNVLAELFFSRCPWADYIACIHDELLFSVPTERLAEAKALMKEAEKELNRQLDWTVAIRVGWAEGQTMYDAK